MRPMASVWLLKRILVFLALFMVYKISSVKRVPSVQLPLFNDSTLFGELSAAASETIEHVKSISYVQHHFLAHVHPERLHNSFILQRFLTCVVEQGEFRPMTGPKAKGQSEVRYEWRPDQRCFQYRKGLKMNPMLPDAEDICAHIRGKRLLMLGDRSQYTLHDLLLHRLSSGTGSHRACAGAEFCNWHAICQPSWFTSAVDNHSENRSEIPPARSFTQKHLVPSNWSHLAIMRYAPSSSLLSSSKRSDRRLTEPYLSSATEIREHESFWRFWVTGSDIIVLSKGPVPAPSWSWKEPLDHRTMHGQTSEWSGFAVRPVWDHNFNKAFRNGNFSSPFLASAWEESAKLPSSVREYRREDIVRAAIRATLQVWLPATLKTLSSLRTESGDAGNTAKKTIIWRGDWFQQEIQDSQTRHKDPTRLESVLALVGTGKQAYGVDDPWRAFHNVQGWLLRTNNPLLRLRFSPHPSSTLSVALPRTTSTLLQYTLSSTLPASVTSCGV